MKSFHLSRRLVTLMLLALLTFGLTSSAQAYTPLSGEQVIIEEGDVIEDDLYVSANTFTLKGVVKGDLIVIAPVVTIAPTGVVEGDLMAAGQGVSVNGRVVDDVRIAGAMLMIGQNAVVGDDVLAAGYSLDFQSGSQVQGDVVIAGNQASVASQVAGDLFAAAEGLRLDGAISGNAKVTVGGGEDVPPFNPFMFMPPVPGLPQAVTIPAGLTFGPNASVGGNLTYVAPNKIEIPAGVVIGEVAYNAPPPEEAKKVEPSPTEAEIFLKWFIRLVRTLVTLLLVGLLIDFALPGFLRRSVVSLNSRLWLSLLWGVIGVAGFVFGLFLIGFVMILVMIILGILTLGDLMGTTLMTGLWLGSTLILGYKLLTAYVAKIVVSACLGMWILDKIKSPAVEHHVWPTVIGVVILAFLWAIPVLGWLVNLAVILFGLGAVLLFARDWYRERNLQKTPATPVLS
jgi:cytoskeletal protein CcmA (bactofilin family)